jgi:serine protease AprX
MIVPIHVRLNAHPAYSGRGVTVAFLDSGFYPHPDLSDRIVAYCDVAGERPQLRAEDSVETWQWHGTQTSVVAAGNGYLCDGVYRGLASAANVVLVKVSENGRITEDNIARGIEWVIANRNRFNIRILNISLGGDEDVPCSRSIIDQAAEEAISLGIAVVVAAGNSGDQGRHAIPPANSPSVITVGGYTDHNQPERGALDLYHSNFGATAGGIHKPEIIALASGVAAPILPVPEDKFAGAHYQHVDGTSFAAPIVSSIVAQMIEAKPGLTPATVKNILISTAERIQSAAVVRQGFGVVNARKAVEAALVEDHQLQSAGCTSLSIRDGRLTFVFHHDNAHSVNLAADFNNWDAASLPLKREASGLWIAEIEPPAAGKYHYKFVVNGQAWLEDPNNGLKAPDNYGGLNSVLIVE